jgi:hypothetical protein
MKDLAYKSVALAALLVLPSCVHVSSDPIIVKANVDVNLKVDRQLDDFFAFESSKAATTQSTIATQPAASIQGVQP